MSLITLKDYPLTTVFHTPAVTSSSEINILFFIPGNPGLVDYYVTYLTLLHKKYPGYEIYCLSHAGYQTSDKFVEEGKKREYGFYNLDYQIEHKYRIITDLTKGRNVNIHFLCHSLGTYITQRLVKRLIQHDNIRIKFIGFICPTIINIKDSSSGQKVVLMMKYLPIVKTATFFSWFITLLLGEAIIKLLLKNFILSSPKSVTKEAKQAFDNSINASYKLIASNRIVNQAVNLVVDEINEINQDDDLNDWFFSELTKKHGVKIWSYFALNDHWVHDSSRNYILDRYYQEDNANLRFEVGTVEDGIAHSFCVDQSVEFAVITAKALSS